MKERTSPRNPAVLSESTQRRLGMYALTASAAGVSLLALAQPGEAKVIYTKAHMPINPYSQAYIDLNHDGIPDFVVYTWLEPHGYFDVMAFYPLQNGAQMARGSQSLSSNHRRGIADFPPGQTVGKDKDFSVGGTLAGTNFYSTRAPRYFGLWAKRRERGQGALRWLAIQYQRQDPLRMGAAQCLPRPIF